jgi:hypothetical protein
MKEDELKLEYFKSNPLRNYAPTKGQTLLPHTFLLNLKNAASGQHSSDATNSSKGLKNKFLV